MAFWLFMFRPDTYEQVKHHGTVGVRDDAARRFAKVRAGDRFVAYVSRLKLLDGYGEVTSDPFEDDRMIFSAEQVYRHRCKVRFDAEGAAVLAGDTLWGLETFSTLQTTSPTNLLFCKGGFIEITAVDYDDLVKMIVGREAGWPGLV